MSPVFNHDLHHKLRPRVVPGTGQAPGYPQHLIEAHVERVLMSATFQRAEQLRRLLEWLAARAIEPAGLAPTEKQIAEQVLNRDNFDPQTDSLVRKEMARLREKLAKFYATEGAREDVRIRADGGYLLKFALAQGRESGGDARPCWLVLPFRSSAELREMSLYLLDELLVCMGEDGRHRLISPTSAIALVGRCADVREFARECGADVVVEGSLRFNRERLEATAWIVDGQTGEAERSRRFLAASVSELSAALRPWLFQRDEETHG